MATVYELDVRIGLSDAITGPLTQLSTVLRQMQGSMDKNQQKLREMGEEGRNMSRSFTQLFVGHEMTKWGEKGAGAIYGMVKAAGDLESALLSVQQATGMSNAEMSKMGTFVQKLASTHTMSVTDAAKMVGIVGRSTFKDPAQMRELLAGGGGQAGIADFADTMKSAGVMGVEESTKLGLQFADLIGGSSPVAALKALDSFQRGLQSSGGVSPTEYFNTFKQIAGTGQALGMDTTQLMQLAAVSSQKGLGTRTTTALANQLVSIEAARSGALQETKGGAKHAKAMDALGLLTGDKNLFAQLTKMRSFGDKNGEEALNKEIFKAFDKRGGKAFLDLLSPQTAQTITRLREEWEKLPSLQEDHAARMQSVNAELAVFDTNLKSIGANLGKAMEPFTKGVLSQLGTASAAAVSYTNAHGDVLTPVLGLVGGLSAAFLGMGSFMTIKGFLGLFLNGGLPVWVKNMPGSVGAPGGPGGTSPGFLGLPNGPGFLGGKATKLGLGAGALAGGIEGYELSAHDSTAGKLADGAIGAGIIAGATFLGGPIGLVLASSMLPLAISAVRAWGASEVDEDHLNATNAANLAKVHADLVGAAKDVKEATHALKQVAKGHNNTGAQLLRGLSTTVGAQNPNGSLGSSTTNSPGGL